jgi:hypothetical protein
MPELSPFILGVLELCVSTGSLSFTRQHDPHSQICSHPEVFVLPFSIAEKIVLAIIPLSNPSVSTSIIFFFMKIEMVKKINN